MGAMIDPISGLLGTHRLRDGCSIFDYAPLTQYVAEDGVTILDEISRAPASSNNILFPLLDKRRHLPVAMACQDGPRRIDMHMDHVITATANIGGSYTGTQQLDAALKNRFFPMLLGYMPPDLESQVLMVRSSVDKSEANLVSRVASDVRKCYMNSEISDSISTRETIQVAELIRDGFSPLRALELVILPKFDDHDEMLIVKGILGSR
jgi:nitric oxide reductase NorQ protein